VLCEKTISIEAAATALHHPHSGAGAGAYLCGLLGGRGVQITRSAEKQQQYRYLTPIAEQEGMLIYVDLRGACYAEYTISTEAAAASAA
jgi:hypothetical protein